MVSRRWPCRSPRGAQAAAGVARTVLDDDAVPAVVSRPVPSKRSAEPAPRLPGSVAWAMPRALLAAIEGIGAEGLDPKDYQPRRCATAIRQRCRAALDPLASRSFTWLIEDLRDGRTPMEARKQWFVVDPDPDMLPTGEVMAEALAEA